jgi:hypothetical protein
LLLNERLVVRPRAIGTAPLWAGLTHWLLAVKSNPVGSAIVNAIGPDQLKSNKRRGLSAYDPKRTSSKWLLDHFVNVGVSLFRLVNNVV